MRVSRRGVGACRVYRTRMRREGWASPAGSRADAAYTGRGCGMKDARLSRGHACLPRLRTWMRHEGTALPTELLPLDHEMGRVVRRLPLDDGIPQRGEIEPREEGLSAAEENGRRREVHRVDEARLQILPNRRHAAADLHVFRAGSGLRAGERLFDPARHEVKGGPSLHHDGLARVM